MALSSLEEYLNREFGELPAAGLEDRAQRRGKDLLDRAPEIDAAAGLNQDVTPWTAPPTAPAEGDWDRTRALASGVVQAGEMALGIPEYIARQNKFLRPSVAPAITGMREGLAGVRESITSGMSEEYLDKIGRELLTMDPDKTMWQGGPIEVADAIYGKFLQSLPSTLLVMLPAARLFRAANTTGALTYLGASEGGLSLGAIQNNLADEIAAMPHEELLKESQAYARHYAATEDETTARQNFTAEAQGLAPVVGGISVAAISATTGRLLAPVFGPGAAKGLTLGRRAGRGFVAEAPQEASQGAAEQIAQNAAATAYDQQRRLMEGVGEAAAQEGLIGGLTGGAVAAAVGQRPTPPLPPAIEGEGGQMGIPGIGPAQPAPEEPAVPEPPEQFVPGVIYPEQQMDIWPDPGTTEAALVPPGVGREEGEVRGPTGEQGVLPILDPRPLRERGPGQRVITEVDQPLPTELPPVEEVAPVEEAEVTPEPGEPEAIAAAMPEMFPAKPNALTAAERRTTTEGFTTRLFDDQNNLIDEQVFLTIEEANELADEYTNDPELFDANVTVEPIRTTAAPTKAGVTTAQQVPVREAEAPAKTRDEKLRDELRTKLPFEERRQVAGFIEDGAVTINAIATRAWDAGLTEIAEKLDPKIRARKTPVKVEPPVEEFDATMPIKDIEGLPDYEVKYPTAEVVTNENKTTSFKEGSETKTFTSQTAAKSWATRAYNKAKKVAERYGRTVSKPKIKAIASEELETKFQAAVAARAGRKQGLYFQRDREAGKPLSPEEAATDEGVLVSRYRKEARAPSQKVQFIRRERAAQLRRAEPIKKVRATPAVTAARPKKKTEVSTAPLTEKTVAGEETAEGEVKRKAKVKEANTRLRFAVNRARKFLSRFDTTGEYGTYVAENTNIDGTLTDAALDFLTARDAFNQLVELAHSALTSGNTSNAHADMAKKIAVALERIKLKTMTPQQFTSEFAAIAKTTEYKMLRSVPQKFRESASERDAKVAKLNNERHNANERQRRLEGDWKGDKIWTEIVGPILRKFSEVTASNIEQVGTAAYYNPSMQEIESLRYALRTYRKMVSRYATDRFYTPIKEQLEYYGFEFDEAGDLVVQEFSPSDNLLGPGFIAKHGISKTAVESTTKEQGVTGTVIDRPAAVQDRTQELETQEITENRQAVVNIRKTNALLDRLKSMIAPAKTTISGIKRQEQRFIRGLRKIGAWVDVSPGMGRISIGGYKSKTYRLVGPRLDAKTMSKAEAKSVVMRIAKIAMPRELAAIAKSMTETETVVESFVEESATEMFYDNLRRGLGNIKPTAEQETAASTAGDLLAEQYSQPTAASVLDAIIESLPKNDFFRNIAERLRALDLSDVTIAYDWTETAFGEGNTTKAGRYEPSKQRVLLNMAAFDKLLADNDPLRHAKFIHTVLHELTHSATVQALAKNARLHSYVLELQQMAVGMWAKSSPTEIIDRISVLDAEVGAMWVAEHNAQDPTTTAFYNEVTNEVLIKQTGGAPPYGLRASSINAAEEFVAEAMSNPEFAQALRNMKIKGESVWAKLRRMVGRILGREQSPEFDNVLDALMTVQEALFEHAGEPLAVDDVLNLELLDGPMLDIAKTVIGRVTQSSGIVQRVKDVAGKSLRNLMTMEQFRDAYQKYFEGALTRYVDAFDRRNAKASQYMNVPQAISRIWTELQETNPEEALEVSRVGSEASINNISARKSVDDPANAHLSDDMKVLAETLHTRYEALSSEGKKVYNDVQKYYRESIERESLFMLQSALRGILTKGKGINLELAVFNERFSIENLKKIDSREALSKAVEDYIPEAGRKDILDTLHKMATLPRMTKGDYNPLMRYGDEVVYAEKEWAPEVYEDQKEAWGVREDRAGSDPTLDVSVNQNDKGQWVVRTFEREFVMGETLSEVTAAREEMIQRYGKENVFDVQKKRSKETDTAINSNAALRSILSTLEGNTAAQAAIKDFYLRQLAETSFRKHEAKRKNRRGVNYDLQHRNLAAYAKSSSYYTAQLEFGWQMGEAISDMSKYVDRRQAAPGEIDTRTLREVVEHLKRRDAMGADLPDIQKLVRQGVEYTHFFMLTSPSYWAINASQPWMVTAPQMAARHGWGQTIAALGHVQKLIKNPLIEQAGKTKGGFASLVKGNRSLTEDAFDVIRQLEDHIKKHAPEKAAEYVTLLEELRDRHIIDINVFTEMRDVAAGKTQSGRDRMIDASRIMAHLTEVNNRVLTALAAYQLEINKGSTIEEATKYAGDMVSLTQFNYSSANKPPLFQAGGPLGGVAPLMFQFMQWPQHMYALMIRNYRGMVDAGVMNKSEARSALLGLLGTHTAVGGMIGMTLQPIKWAVGMVMMAFGDEDEPYTFANMVSGRTFDRLIADASADAFGTTVSTLVSRGAPAALGIDLSTRMSMGTFYFIDMRGETAESALGSIIASFGGATLNQGINIARGIGKVARGDVMKGVEQMSPKIARDAIRSVRYYNEGLVNNAGDTVIPADEMSIPEVVAQFFGFAPTDISQHYAAQSAIKGAERYTVARKSDLMRRYRLADSSSERRDVRDDIREFNRSNPAERITHSALIQNRRAKREREASYRRYGANIDERKARQYEKYGRAYR